MSILPQWVLEHASGEHLDIDMQGTLSATIASGCDNQLCLHRYVDVTRTSRGPESKQNRRIN